jgi:hypothetical protein
MSSNHSFTNYDGSPLEYPRIYFNYNGSPVRHENKQAELHWLREVNRHNEERYQHWLRTGKGNTVGFEERRDAEKIQQMMLCFTPQKTLIETAFASAIADNLQTIIKMTLSSIMPVTINELTRHGYIVKEDKYSTPNITIEPNMQFTKITDTPYASFILDLPSVQIFIDRINKMKQYEIERKQLADIAEQKRLFDIAEAKRIADIAEQKRLFDIAEAKRIADEIERKRLFDIAEAKRIADEIERKRLFDIAEAKRIADEIERKILFDIAETKRIADETEQKRIDELNKLAEIKRQEEEAEKNRLLKEEQDELIFANQKKEEYAKMAKDRLKSNPLFAGFDFSFN